MLNTTLSTHAFSPVSLEELMASLPQPRTGHKRIRSRRQGVERVLRREGAAEIRRALRGEIETLDESDVVAFEDYEDICHGCWSHPCSCDMLCDDGRDDYRFELDDRCVCCGRLSRCDCDAIGDDDFGYHGDSYFHDYPVSFRFQSRPSPFADDDAVVEFLLRNGGANLEKAVADLNDTFGSAVDVNDLKLHDFFWAAEERWNAHFAAMDAALSCDDDAFFGESFDERELTPACGFEFDLFVDSLWSQPEPVLVDVPRRRGLFIELSGQQHRVKRVKARLGDCYWSCERDNEKRRLLERELHTEHRASMAEAAETIALRNREVEMLKQRLRHVKPNSPMARSMRAEHQRKRGGSMVAAVPQHTVEVFHVETKGLRRQVKLAGHVHLMSLRSDRPRYVFQPAKK